MKSKVLIIKNLRFNKYSKYSKTPCVSNEKMKTYKKGHTAVHCRISDDVFEKAQKLTNVAQHSMAQLVSNAIITYVIAVSKGSDAIKDMQILKLHQYAWKLANGEKDDDLMTLTDAAKLLRFSSIRRVSLLIKKGKLKAYGLSYTKKKFVKRGEVKALMKAKEIDYGSCAQS